MGTILALVALAGSAWAVEPTRRYALLVGANDGGEGRTVLQYAHRDARAVQQVLTTLGGVHDADQTLLLDPTLDELSAEIGRLSDQIDEVGGRAEFVFYYSGHSDETGLLLGGSHYEYPELREQLEALPAKVRLAILDSCASGAMIRTKGGKRIAPFLVDESSEVGGFAYITSSSATEVAQEGDRIGGSYFTHYLTTGLRGAADLSGDGRVDLNEAYSFAYEATLSHTEKTQHGPQHAMKDMNLSGKGDLVLTDLQLTTASLVLEEGLVGRALVRDDEGNLVAEVNKDGGRPVELGLEEGHYTVTLTRQRGDRYGVAEIDLLPDASTLVGAADITWWDGERTVARGSAAEPPLAALGAPRELEADPSPFRLHYLTELPPQGRSDTFVLGLPVARSNSLKGASLAGFASVVEEDASGIQTSLLLTDAGELHGLQAGLLWNQAGGGDGWQSSIGANVVTGSFIGVQGTVGLNVSQGGMDGLQGAMGANIADGIRGLQLGLVNVGSSVGGAQIGLINIAGDVNGAQIGLINVAREVKGAPLGLLSFEREGRHDLSIYASESDLATVDFKLGGKYVYTLLGAGGMPGRHVHLAAGVGAHIPIAEGKLWLDLDGAYAAYIGSDFDFDEPLTPVARGRATLGWQIAPQFAPFVGVSGNVRIPVGAASTVAVAPTWLAPTSSEVAAWPGAFVGLQF